MHIASQVYNADGIGLCTNMRRIQTKLVHLSGTAQTIPPA